MGRTRRGQHPRAVGGDTTASQWTPTLPAAQKVTWTSLNSSRPSQPTLDVGERLQAMRKDTVPAHVAPKTHVPGPAPEGGSLFLWPQLALQFYLQDYCRTRNVNIPLPL